MFTGWRTADGKFQGSLSSLRFDDIPIREKRVGTFSVLGKQISKKGAGSFTDKSAIISRQREFLHLCILIFFTGFFSSLLPPRSLSHYPSLTSTSLIASGPNRS